AAGAFHGMGLAYYELQDHVEASRYLIRSLKAVDTELAANANEIEELNNVYNGLMVAVEGRSTESLSLINERFTGLLSGKEWKQRIAETRRHLDETLRDEGSQGLVDILVARGGDDLPETVASIDRYIRQGLFVLAMNESHRAVEKSPYYLPIHVRQAEIMMKEGRIRQAINKYNTVARAYLVRDENDRAASILEEVLHMAPLDIEVRMSLIELLESEGRQLEVLNQYIELASTYQQLGDFDMSNQTFASAERLARRIDAPSDKLVEIKHHIADISQMRLNIRHAQKIYEEILELQKDDEKALRSLVDIYYNQNNQMEAVKRLDVLLGTYARNKQIDKITGLLAEMVRSMPQDTALRDRLAKIYYRTGKKKEAIEQLDALGELQLDAGLNKDAARTIKQIIQMGPEQVDDYKKLLSQLNG
ncbi:MAG: tetratricopeptide repeat protein, partial [Aggregatilineales bacterium]